MSRKHNTKHNRGKSNYPRRRAGRDTRQSDVRLSDGKLSSVSR